jgi:hypothetical protein
MKLLTEYTYLSSYILKMNFLYLKKYISYPRNSRLPSVKCRVTADTTVFYVFKNFLQSSQNLLISFPNYFLIIIILFISSEFMMKKMKEKINKSR